MPQKSKRKRSVPRRYRDDTDDSSAATRQRTVSDADASVPAPQASPSSMCPSGRLWSVGLSAQQNVSTGEQQTFPIPGNSSSFSSVPLGALVDAKLKAKIWTGQ